MVKMAQLNLTMTIDKVPKFPWSKLSKSLIILTTEIFDQEICENSRNLANLALPPKILFEISKICAVI
jgi:hypothetical protein